jgi:hypothetical protein
MTNEKLIEGLARQILNGWNPEQAKPVLEPLQRVLDAGDRMYENCPIDALAVAWKLAKAELEEKEGIKAGLAEAEAMDPKPWADESAPPSEPTSHDGHDWEGFPGGCKRLGCPPNCKQCDSTLKTGDGQLLRCQFHQRHNERLHESGDWEWLDGDAEPPSAPKSADPRCVTEGPMSAHDLAVYKRALEDAAPALCHLAWCCYQLGCGQPYNETPTAAQLESHRNALKAFQANPAMTAEENHENWMSYRLSQGWKYGPVKDEKAKTHPDLIPFDQLPEVERNKDVMDLLARRTIRALTSGAGRET